MYNDTAKLVRRMVFAGFDGYFLPDSLVAEVQKGELGGVTLFRRNVENAEQVHDLLSQIRKEAPVGEAALTCVDQEGGRVVRLGAPLTHLPPALTMSSANDAKAIYEAGVLVGRELRAVGFTLNFAPVMDVNTNPDSPVIGDRAFGGSAARVIEGALAFARGLKEGGVFPCAKHFPGHGDASVDSHKSLPTVIHNTARLEEIELEPFAAYARCGLGAMMTAHVSYPSLDSEYPATLSRKILTDLLQKKLHFDGLIITDDLEMGAIRGGIGAAEAAVASVRAGAHALLVCSDLALREQVIARLVDAARASNEFLAKIELSAKKISAMVQPPGLEVPFSFLGSDAHREMVAQVTQRFEQ